LPVASPEGLHWQPTTNWSNLPRALQIATSTHRHILPLAAMEGGRAWILWSTVDSVNSTFESVRLDVLLEPLFASGSERAEQENCALIANQNVRGIRDNLRRTVHGCVLLSSNTHQGPNKRTALRSGGSWDCLHSVPHPPFGKPPCVSLFFANSNQALSDLTVTHISAIIETCQWLNRRSP